MSSPKITTSASNISGVSSGRPSMTNRTIVPPASPLMQLLKHELELQIAPVRQVHRCIDHADFLAFRDVHHQNHLLELRIDDQHLRHHTLSRNGHAWNPLWDKEPVGRDLYVVESDRQPASALHGHHTLQRLGPVRTHPTNETAGAAARAVCAIHQRADGRLPEEVSEVAARCPPCAPDHRPIKHTPAFFRCRPPGVLDSDQSRPDPRSCRDDELDVQEVVVLREVSDLAEAHPILGRVGPARNAVEEHDKVVERLDLHLEPALQPREVLDSERHHRASFNVRRVRDELRDGRRREELEPELLPHVSSARQQRIVRPRVRHRWRRDLHARLELIRILDADLSHNAVEGDVQVQGRGLHALPVRGESEPGPAGDWRVDGLEERRRARDFELEGSVALDAILEAVYHARQQPDLSQRRELHLQGPAIVAFGNQRQRLGLLLVDADLELVERSDRAEVLDEDRHCRGRVGGGRGRDKSGHDRRAEGQDVEARARTTLAYSSPDAGIDRQAALREIGRCREDDGLEAAEDRGAFAVRGSDALDSARPRAAERDGHVSLRVGRRVPEVMDSHRHDDDRSLLHGVRQKRRHEGVRVREDCKEERASSGGPVRVVVDQDSVVARRQARWESEECLGQDARGGNQRSGRDLLSGCHLHDQRAFVSGWNDGEVGQVDSHFSPGTAGVHLLR
eukprot:36150-Rhodomonas_salina.2